MNNIEKAVSLINQGRSCAQAILTTYGIQFGIDEDIAFRITSSMGGGLARCGYTCGAITGALMVIGLKYRNLDIEDQENKDYTYEVGKDFINQFKRIHGTIICRELLGCDISTLEGREKAERDNLFEDLCPKYVRDSAELLESILREGRRER